MIAIVLIGVLLVALTANEWRRRKAMSTIASLTEADTHAASAERKRLARLLHDSAVQSLVAAEIQIEVLRRRGAAAGEAPQTTDTLARVQMLLRDEIASLRDLIRQLNTQASEIASLEPEQTSSAVDASVSSHS